MRPRLLIIDDEPKVRRILELALGDRGYEVSGAGTAAEGLRMAEQQPFDVVLTDLQLPDRSGMEILAALQERRARLPVILITAYGTVESAVQAMKLGAFDFVLKPFQIDEIEALVSRAVEMRRTARENEYLRTVTEQEFEGIVSASAQMRVVIDAIERVAAAPTTVLITGETGVGKELVARAIHRRSARAHGLFVPINCAAIPSDLLEAELFGVTRGAFTGAIADRPGKFELADGGTLFLDEIGDMPAHMQPKLLRVLQEGVIERVGSPHAQRVDARVVAATHGDLARMVADGTFREDLYYRLNVFPIHVPPLRERREDIAAIAQAIVRRLSRSLGRATGISNEAVQLLERYDWPGNVRELGNVLERAVLLASGELIEPADLRGISAAASHAATPAGEPLSLRSALERAERNAIEAALAATEGNKTAAARLLGVSVRSLWYKLERLGLDARA